MRRKIEIGPETVLQRNNEILFNEINGEVVMLSIETGEYFGMNSIGSFIWNILTRTISFSELIRQLINEFNVAEEECISDTIEFLKVLSEKKLIKIV